MRVSCFLFTDLHIFSFAFQLPHNAPASVTLQPAPGDTGKVSRSFTRFINQKQNDTEVSIIHR